MAYISKRVRLNELMDEIVNNMAANGWSVERAASDITPPHTSDVANIVTGHPGRCLTINGSAFPAFDGDFYNATVWNSTTTPTVPAPQRIGYDFGDGNEKRIVRYNIYPGSTVGRAPKSWQLEGSNDNTNWTVLDARSNIDNWYMPEDMTSYNESSRKSFFFQNNTSFRYYRLSVTGTVGNSACSILQLEFCEDVATTNYSEYVFKSSGTNGNDNIVVILDPHLYNMTKEYPDVMINAFRVGFAEAYNHSTGEFINRDTNWYYTTTVTGQNQNDSNVFVTYHMDIDRDRMLLVTELDPSAIYPLTNATVIGMMQRYSEENNNHAQIFGLAVRAYSALGPRVLKDRHDQLYKELEAQYVNHKYAPSAWGDGMIFVSPIYLEGVYEGMRGEMKGIYTAKPDNIIHEDEVIIGNDKYKAFVTTATGNNSFPTTCILIRL